ncbi:sporulation-delaying protein SdpB family protein [Streptomyces caatingaensis]|uniref:sporulation-delaying protein SdpB family protein n=1 Tax=Streptomyces caatingaensis TaxID=1678637 RepID=UPI00069EE3CC|nr:sporulation-delaying protein SdpB family protein [Streptomyces caatingaensis]
MLTAPRSLVLPWTNVYGLARTLVALGTAGTLAFSSAQTLFRPVYTMGDYPLCKRFTAGSAFCLAPDSYPGLTWIKWGCVVVLLVTASGWRPRWTGLPHAYVNYSVYTGIAIGDGGDQIALILSVLFALVTLGDARRWHWQTVADGAGTTPPGRVLALVGTSALVVARLQMSFVYFQASVAKLPHAEWADGTAMWYWGQNPAFGAPSWLRPLVHAVVSAPWGVALMTWLPLVIEISLAAALLLPRRARRAAMAAGLFFHLCIALVMGLWSFALAMAGGIVVLCLPLGSALHRRRASSGDEPAPQQVDDLGVGEPALPRQGDKAAAGLHQ